MKRKIKICLLINFALFIISSVHCQNLQKVKILEKPKKFLVPKKYTGKDREIFINDKSRKRSENLWMVVSDRSNNYTFDKPGGSGKKEETLKFGQVFYVIDEDKEWIKLGKLEEIENKRNTKLEVYGWILKDNMLLWNNGLSTENSIHLKAFLLNKLKQVRIDQSLQEAPYYHDPDFEINKTFAVDNLNLFSFYYIYKIKYDDIGRPIAYLLGKESHYNPAYRSDLLLGWVSSHRVDEWNTRLALTPNFGIYAFPERKSNINNLRARGYINHNQAIDYVKNTPNENHNNPNNIIWDQDPAKGSSPYISKSDPKRFANSVIRFPVLKYHKNEKYYKSGVIKELITNASARNDSRVVTGRKDLIVSTSKEFQNLNVFFLIDGTNERFANQITNMTNIIKEINSDTEQFKRIQTGIGVYKDCNNSENHYKREALTRDVNKTIDFLHNIRWGQPDRDDEYNCVISALWETLRKANFETDATNVIVHIGDQPDIGNTKRRGRDAKKYSSEKKQKNIEEMISDYHINLISLDFENKNDRASDDFQLSERLLINDLYKNMLLEIDIEGVEFRESYLEDFEEGINEIRVTNFPYIFSFKIPFTGNYLKPSELRTFILNNIQEVKIQQQNTKLELEKIEKEGLKKQPSSGVYSVEAIHIIRKALKKREEGLTEKEIVAMLEKADGTSFYSEVFLPATSKAHGAKHLPWCYVMFLPREDLDNYIKQLKKLENAMDNPGDKKRELLQETLADLAETLTGQQSAKSLKKINIDDIEQLLAGIKDQGLDVQSRYKVRLVDITDTRKFPNRELNKFQRRTSEKLRTLEGIYNDNEYEFMYDSGYNKYYWIPFSEIF